MLKEDIKRCIRINKINKSLLCYKYFMSVFGFSNKLYKILYIKSYKTYLWGLQSFKNKLSLCRFYMVYKHFYNIKYIFELLNIYIVGLCRYIMIKETLENELNLNCLYVKGETENYIKGGYLK